MDIGRIKFINFVLRGLFYIRKPSPILQKLISVLSSSAGSITDLESNNQEGFLICKDAFAQSIFLYSDHSVRTKTASASVNAFSSEFIVSQ